MSESVLVNPDHSLTRKYLKLFHDLGADFNTTHGRYHSVTPLQLYIQDRCNDAKQEFIALTISDMISYGADPNLKDGQQKSALDYADKYCNPQTAGTVRWGLTHPSPYHP